MIAYPSLATALHLDPNAAAVFLGGSIHDVAQVVAAGYLISPEVGDAAVFVKLLRVAMLLPVVLVLSLVFRNGKEEGAKPPLLPLFLVGFAILMVINSVGLIPHAVSKACSDLSFPAGVWWWRSLLCVLIPVTCLVRRPALLTPYGISLIR